MASVDVAAVARRLRELVPDDLWCDARAVANDPIHPGERALFTGVADRGRRATATGRMLARQVLRSMGVSGGPILRRSGGRPDWPIGITGSIAHDDDVCVCVCGTGTAIGVDVEPIEPLPAEIMDDVVCSDADRAVVGDDLIVARVLFCAKEAVYKACFPLDERFLEFSDVTVDAAVATALRPGRDTALWMMTTTTGRRVRVTVARTPRLLAFARVMS